MFLLSVFVLAQFLLSREISGQEAVLNRLMGDYGGFEGNAQTLRMITEIMERDDHQPTPECLKEYRNFSLDRRVRAAFRRLTS